MFAAALVLSVLLAVFFAATGVPKIAGAKLMHEVADHFGLARIAAPAVAGPAAIAALALCAGTA